MTQKEKDNFMKMYNAEVDYYLNLCKYNELNSESVKVQGEKLADLRRIITQVFERKCFINDASYMVRIDEKRNGMIDIFTKVYKEKRGVTYVYSYSYEGVDIDANSIFAEYETKFSIARGVIQDKKFTRYVDGQGKTYIRRFW